MTNHVYQLTWRSPTGDVIDYLNHFTSMDMAYGEMVPGVCDLVLPMGDIKMGDFQVDQMIDIRRGSEGGPLRLEGERSWFVRDWTFSESQVTLKLFDGNYLLGCPIVAYAAGSAQATKKKVKSDDLMKAVVRENLGFLATDTARRNAGITIQADDGLGPVVSKEFSRDEVLKVLQDLHAFGLEQTIPVYIGFEMINVGPAKFEFQTYYERRGANRGSSGERLVFSKQQKNLSNPVYEERHSEERTFVYAGGSGEKAARAIQTAYSQWLTASPWNRRELFKDSSGTKDKTALLGEAKAALFGARPARFISGTIMQTDGCRYNIDYGYGDSVVCEVFGYSSDCRISTVHITVNDRNLETIDIKLKGEVIDDVGIL